MVDKADSIYVRTIDNRTHPAKVIGTDPKADIAVIKIEAKNLTAIKQGNSDQLRVGEWVIAIGSPLSANLDHTVTQGIVSAKGRSNVGLADYEDFIQTDAAINPGNSGGALINLDGELVGINTAIASRSGGFQGIGFAVPINMAKKSMESLIEHGRVIRGWLGVSIQDITQSIAKAMDLEDIEGILVGDVVEDSPADKAGFQEEDVIISLNGKKVTGTTQLRNEISGTSPGTSVRIKVIRDGKEKFLTVVLDELPGDISMAGGAKPQLEDLLGFSVANVNRQLSERYDLGSRKPGVVVTEIDRNSNAYREGVREGDLIRKVNRKRIENSNEFNIALKGAKRGDHIILQVSRQSRNFFLAFGL